MQNKTVEIFISANDRFGNLIDTTTNKQSNFTVATLPASNTFKNFFIHQQLDKKNGVLLSPFVNVVAYN